jgi:formylglycine-generating enzyme required for sulfatase activity
MPTEPGTAVLLAFLQRFLADRAAGRHVALADYVAAFPGHEERIRAEFARLQAGAEAPEHDDAPPSTPARIAQYRLLRRLGRGGQGTVWLADDTHLGRTVALKLLLGLGPLDAEALARFRREAEATSRLQHPGICTIYERGEDAGTPFLAMAFVDGVSLADRLASGDRMPVDAVLHLFATAADALAAAHRAGIVHRDVKPGNIMITPSGDAVLLDFGIARLLHSDEATLTGPDHLPGTPAYLSPEQIAGDPTRLDHRTDIHALGVSLFETLTGTRPFRAATRDALYRQILAEGPPDPRDLEPTLPRDLAVVVRTAMAKDPFARYQSAEDLAEDLRNVLGSRPILARPPGSLRRVGMWARRNRGWAATLAAATVALVATAAAATAFAWRAEALLTTSRQLADKPLYDALVATAREELHPPLPSRLARFDRWLDRVQALLAREPDHRRALAELRRRAAPPSAEDLAKDRRGYELEYANLEDLERQAKAGPLSAELTDYRRRIEERVAQRVHFRFEDPDDQLHHDVLRDLVASLERLRDEGIVNANTLAAIRHRRTIAEQLGERIVGEDAAAWQWCATHLAADPRFDGVAIEPIPGLVPLGCDAGSGLVEFWHVTSGSRPQWRGEPLGKGTVELSASGDEGLVLVLLPGGACELGAQKPGGGGKHGDPHVDIGADGGEAPVHRVELAPFLLGKFEVTRGQWRRLFDVEHIFHSALPGAREPIVECTWEQAVECCRRWDLVLPTEAQWEYACRAGTTSPWYTGPNVASLRGHANAGGTAFAERAVWQDDHDGVAPVGSLLANSFGLHDVHGNVREWCRDGSYPYGPDWPTRAGDGLRGYDTGPLAYVVRSGSWRQKPRECRSSRRDRARFDVREDDLGFRAARGLAVTR